MILGDEGGTRPRAAELAASLGAMAGGDGATADAAYLAASDSDGDDDLVRNPPTEAELAERAAVRRGRRRATSRLA